MDNLVHDIPLILASLCVLVFVIGITLLCVHVYRKHREARILKESPRLAALRVINAQYDFKPVKPLEFTREVDMKRKFDRFDPDGYLLSLISEEPEQFKKWAKDSEFNSKLFDDYKKRLHEVPKSSYTNEKWRLVELDLLNRDRLDPCIRPPITIFWFYKSPAGRNYYSDEKVFDHAQVNALMEMSVDIAEEKSSRQMVIKRERALMTDSLRYDILARDNFTCQICGSTARDGVKLEVDHIIPVSKGGKTEPGNLRTLCDRCNRGKRDKV